MSEDLERVERALAQRIATPQAEGFMERRQGAVTAVNANGTVDVSVGGVVIPGVRYKTSYGPVVGDGVFIEVVGTDFVVDGTLALLGPNRRLLAETRLGGAVATVTLTIPAARFVNLRLVASVRDTLATGSNDPAGMSIFFNGDTTNTNYRQHFWQANAAGTTSSASNDTAGYGLILPGTNGAPRFANNEFLVVDYRSTDKYKFIVGHAEAMANDGGSDYLFKNSHGFWVNTAVVTSVTFDATNDFAQASYFAAYGE